jgi:hypothetical protein
MSSSNRGTVLLKNGPEYILGRFYYKAEEVVKEFFTYQIFKYAFTNIWPEFRKFHITKLGKSELKEQPKSLFLESGLQLELMDTKRDLTCRQVFRDFLTGPIIGTMSALGSSDGFYADLGSSEVWVFVDYLHKRIYINGEKVYKKSVSPKDIPEDTPMMKHIKGMSSSKSQNSVIHQAFDRLKSSGEIIKFFHEYVEWLRQHGDLPEEREDPVTSIQRQIGACFNYYGSSTRLKWQNALDFNHKSIQLEFLKMKLPPAPYEMTEGA